jgi:hypothetical protein
VNHAVTAEERASMSDAKDVLASSLQTHIPDLLARDTPNYLAEYGVRITDEAMVFHFFPPKDRTGWDSRWQPDMRLKAAIDEHFDTRYVSASYVEELQSFCVIVGGLGAAPDPWPLVEKFFRALDADEA